MEVKPDTPENSGVAVEEPTVAVEEPQEAQAEEEAEKKPLFAVEDDDGNLLTPKDLIDSAKTVKDRIKDASTQPVKNMFASYIKQGLSIVESLADGLEGKKKDK